MKYKYAWQVNYTSKEGRGGFKSAAVQISVAVVL